MANSYTDQLKLRKPTFGDGNWDDEINGNSQILEVALAAVLEDNYTVSGLVASDGGGLTVDYTSGVVVVAGTEYAVDAGSKTATDNTDGTNAPNFLYVDSSGVMQISITPPTGEYAPIAVVDTLSAAITRVGDLRLQKTLGVAAGNVARVDQAETSVASASSITLATTLNQLLTGTTPVDTINSVAGRTNRIRVETGGFALNHSAGLNCLQTGATITTAAGDTFKWFALTASTGFVFDYVRASGVGLKKIASYYRSAANEGIPGHGDGVNTTQVIFTIPTPMRYLTPVTGVSASDPSHFSIGDGTTNIVCTNIAFASGGVGSVRITVTVAAGAAQYRTYLLFFNNALGTLTFTGQTYE
jgi:hypothetical protein